MAAYISELIFNCTPTQFATAMSTTLPGASYTATQAPIKFTGIIQHATYGQVDFAYDGMYFLKFFGANPIPVGQEASAGISQNQLSPQLIANLTTTFAGTLGAPVPVNQANVPSNAANA